MGNRLLGVSINENSLRCAVIEKEEGKVLVKSLFEVAFDGQDLSKLDSETIKSLKEFVKHSKHTKSAVSLPASKVLTRLKTVPKIPTQKIVKLIQTEIRDYAIFEGENVALGFTELEESDSTIDLLWAATKESTLISYLSFLRKIGVKTNKVTIPQLALIEFVNEFYNEGDYFAVLNVDRESTTLTVSKGKRVVFNNTQDIGFEAFKVKDLSLQGTWVGNVISSINYVSRNLNIAVKKIYLTVNSSNPFDILTFLASRVGVPVLMLGLPEDVSFENEEDFIKYQRTGGNEFAIAVGLALISQLEKGEASYLSLTEHLLRERISERLKVLATILVLLVVNGAFALAYPYISSSLKITESQLANITKSINEISIPAEDAAKLQADLQAVKSTFSGVKNLDTTLRNALEYSLVLREMRDLLPQGCAISELSLKEDGSISLKGTSNTFRNVFNYEENLSSAKYVYNATILEIVKDKESSGIFTMQLQMRKQK